MTGMKHDENPYEKADLSLVPLDVIEMHLDSKCIPASPERDTLRAIFINIHDMLNSDQELIPSAINNIFKECLKIFGINELAVALGLGAVKYERNNWKKFDSDPYRFLRATLRHLLAVLEGKAYDDDKIKGYDKGNTHKGGVLFSLMVARHILTTASTPAIGPCESASCEMP